MRRGSSVSIVVCFSSAEVRVHAPAPTQPHGHVLVCRYADAGSSKGFQMNNTEVDLNFYKLCTSSFADEGPQEVRHLPHRSPVARSSAEQCNDVALNIMRKLENLEENHACKWRTSTQKSLRPDSDWDLLEPVQV